MFLSNYVVGSRLFLRSVFRNINKQRKNIAIYGAGSAGSQIIQALKFNFEYEVKLIIDDAPLLGGQKIFGHEVMGFAEATKKFNELNINTVLLSIPSASFSARKKILSRLSEYAVEVKTIPGLSDLINGSVQINEFKDIEINELIGREMIEADPLLLSKNISGKSVLVTGAGGSIGAELCSQIIELKPKQLLIVDVSEFAIYKTLQNLEQKALEIAVPVSSFVGSVQDRLFISNILRNNSVDVIFHAAAYKHVPLMEMNAFEAIKNNTLATFILSEEAIRYKISTFTLISSDKAVNPTNIMGASKRLAERICHSMNKKNVSTRFSIVRFGNVVGSSGSVIPLFKRQIKSGGPITLTHPNVSRYFMTINEAVQLVIQASALSKFGEIFILDMGEPITIKDLAFKMTSLSGRTAYMENNEAVQDGDIAVRVIGLRHGEKLYEELSYTGNLTPTSHPRIMQVNEKKLTVNQIQEMKSKLELIVKSNNQSKLIDILETYANYTPKSLN
jgi:FlaA1/EpsC-like NDP-sugar epimerase